MTFDQSPCPNLSVNAFSDAETESTAESSEPQSENEGASFNAAEGFRESLERERERLLEQNQALEEYSQSMVDGIHRLLARCVVLGKKNS